MGNSSSGRQLWGLCASGDIRRMELQFSKVLEKVIPADFESSDEYGRTPLHLLLAMKSCATLSFLTAYLAAIPSPSLKYKVVTQKDERGWTSLHYACHTQNLDAVSLLLKTIAGNPIPSGSSYRDSHGLLPQDYLILESISDSSTKSILQSLKDLDQQQGFHIVLWSLRPSGPVQLQYGQGLQRGECMTLKFDIPTDDNYTVGKDYIQMLVYEGSSMTPSYGPLSYIKDHRSQKLVTFSSADLPVPSTVRFVYVKTDVNGMTRSVVASGCNARISLVLEESVTFDLYIQDKVLEIESVSDFVYGDANAILLKRIGIPNEEDKSLIEWKSVASGNYITEVNDVAVSDFDGTIKLLKTREGSGSTKLKIQNMKSKGDFIPEKVLGPNVIGKYASLVPSKRDSSSSTTDSWDESNFSMALSSPT